MELDYKLIGQRVKICRIKSGLTQEKTAGLAGLTAQHISNIETGNTKVSLPTLVAIANALSVSIDSFLIDNVLNSKNVMYNEACEIFEDSNPYETRIFLEVLKSTKKAIQDSVKLKELLGSEDV